MKSDGQGMLYGLELGVQKTSASQVPAELISRMNPHPTTPIT
jgi:hypothetical protein